MNVSEHRHAHSPAFRERFSAPVIPTTRTPWFMRALWVLAVLMLVGIVYSFWRISVVPAPSLDVPPTGQPAATPAR